MRGGEIGGVILAVGQLRGAAFAEISDSANVALKVKAVVFQSDAKRIVVPLPPGKACAEVVWKVDGVFERLIIPEKVGVPASRVPDANPKLGCLRQKSDALAGNRKTKVLLEVEEVIVGSPGVPRSLNSTPKGSGFGIIKRSRRNLELSNVTEHRDRKGIISRNGVVHAQCVFLEGGSPVKEFTGRGIPRAIPFARANMEAEVNP